MKKEDLRYEKAEQLEALARCDRALLPKHGQGRDRGLDSGALQNRLRSSLLGHSRRGKGISRLACQAMHHDSRRLEIHICREDASLVAALLTNTL
jgi:hypothetical protein